MKINKKKIVFVLILVCILLYIIGYAMTLFDKNEESAIENNEVPVPELKDEQKQYESKLDALNDLKEVRQTNAPSIYDERLLDSTGTYNPELLDKDRVLAITKSDMLDEELTEEIKEELPEGIETIFISSVAQQGITELKDLLWKYISD